MKMDEAVAAVAKEAQTFAEIKSQRDAAEAAWRMLEGLNGMVGTLGESLMSIIHDEETSDKTGRIRKSLDEFMEAVDDALTPSGDPDEDGERFERSVQILAKDEDRRLVFGIFSMTTVGKEEVVDSEEERIETEELERAGYEFVLESRAAGERHKRIGVGKLVEHVVLTKEKQDCIVGELQAQGIDAVMDLKCEFAWGGFYIDDDEVWAKVKSGEYGAFSIGGMASREEEAV